MLFRSLVHMRNPIQTHKQLGFYGWWALQATTLGIIVSSLFHPFLIGLAVYMFLSGHMLDGTESQFITLLLGLNIVVLFVGYLIAICAGAKALRFKNIKGWWFVLATMPIYWVLISIAGWLAIWQLAFKPHHWNKTNHGQSRLHRP